MDRPINHVDNNGAEDDKAMMIRDEKTFELTIMIRMITDNDNGLKWIRLGFVMLVIFI